MVLVVIDGWWGNSGGGGVDARYIFTSAKHTRDFFQQPPSSSKLSP